MDKLLKTKASTLNSSMDSNLTNNDRWRPLEKVFNKIEHIPREDIITLLDHQLEYNETLSDIGSDIHSHRFLQSFRRLSINIVTSILRQLKAPQLVDFVPIKETLTPAYHHDLQTVFSDPEAIREYHNHQFGLDAEMELASFIAKNVAMEIDQHILWELRHHAGIVAYIDSTDPDTNFISRFHGILSEVQRNCNVYPNWIVASSQLGVFLSEAAFDFDPAEDHEAFSFGIRYLGTVNWKLSGRKIRLYENHLAPEQELLVGYKGTERQPYQFKPKILLEALPNRHKQRKVRTARLKTQFDTHWPENGGDLYARITVKGPD